MENFVVSARKYRPVTFDTVVGQNSITSTLKNAIKNNQLAQAFLFCGPRGVGKTTCARILAKTINCENRTEQMEACDQCESCTSFNNSASFNIHELDAASNNSVDDIRNLVEQVRIPPQVGKYKVYIIDEVHMLSTAAFNAFLKTLEEPPAYAKFILATTEKHKIIPTILSRCQIFDFKRIVIDDIAKHLDFIAKNESINAEADGLHIIAQKADGALRDALSIFDQIVSFSGSNVTYKNVIENLNVLDYDYYFKIVDAINNNDISSILLLLNEIIENGFDGQHFIIGLGEHLRNLLVCKNPETLALLEVGDNIREKYALQANQSELRLILNCLDVNNKCDINYKSSNNKRLHLELSLLQMCALSKQIAAASGRTQQTAEVKKKSEPVAQAQVQTQAQAQTQTQTQAQAQAQAAPKVETKVEDKVEETPSKDPIKIDNYINTPTEQPTKVESAVKDDKPEYEAPKPSVPPQEKPKTEAKPSVRIPGSISIKGFAEKHAEAAKEEIEEQEALLNGPVNEFTQEQLLEKWKEYLKSISIKKPGFSNALLKYEPELKDDYVVEFKTDNKVLADDTHNRTELQAFLKKELNNSRLTLKSVVVQEVKSTIAYTDQDKYQKMIKKNPDIKDLREKLDLEIDF